MKIIHSNLVLWIIPLLCNCSNDKKVAENEMAKVEIIKISVSKAIRANAENIALSQFVDSIELIPLETYDKCLLNGYPLLSITPEYLFYYNFCFDWNGNFLRKIGNFGQGIGEEPGSIISQITYLNNKFYSKGMKIIEYDKTGTFSGKEISLYKIDNNKLKGDLTQIAQLSNTKNNLVAFNYPDTVYFFNTDFNIISKYPIMKWNRKQIPQALTSKYDKYFTSYNDTLIFYNYYTDTVYHVIDKTLEPKWILELDDTDKLSTDYLYKFDELSKESFDYWKSGNIEECRMCKLIDNRIKISAVYESDKYLMILAYKTMFAREFRKLNTTETYYNIMYDKISGKLISTKCFKDNLLGIGNFFPYWGISKNCMINLIWPSELMELIETNSNNNIPINKRVLDLLEKINIEDNPILVLAHLKN